MILGNQLTFLPKQQIGEGLNLFLSWSSQDFTFPQMVVLSLFCFFIILKIFCRTTSPNTCYYLDGYPGSVPPRMLRAWSSLGISPSELCTGSPRILEACGYRLVSSGWAPAPSHQGGPREKRGVLKEFVRMVQA